MQETGQRTRSVMIVTVPDLPAPKNDTEDTAKCCYKRLNVPHDSVKTNSLSLALCSSLLPFLFITSVWENYWNPCILRLTLIAFSMKKKQQRTCIYYKLRSDDSKALKCYLGTFSCTVSRENRKVVNAWGTKLQYLLQPVKGFSTV